MSSTASTSDPELRGEQKCQLLELPREIRDQILSYIVYRPNALVLSNDLESRPGQPAVALTCQQIRDESLELFARLNRFIFVYGHYVPKLPTAVKYMKYIKIRFYRVSWSFALDLRRGVKNFQFLEMESSRRDKPRKALHSKLGLEVKLWMKRRIAKGDTSLTKDTLHDLLHHIRIVASARALGGC